MRDAADLEALIAVHVAGDHQRHAMGGEDGLDHAPRVRARDVVAEGVERAMEIDDGEAVVRIHLDLVELGRKPGNLFGAGAHVDLAVQRQEMHAAALVVVAVHGRVALGRGGREERPVVVVQLVELLHLVVADADHEGSGLEQRTHQAEPRLPRLDHGHVVLHVAHVDDELGLPRVLMIEERDGVPERGVGVADDVGDDGRRVVVRRVQRAGATGEAGLVDDLVRVTGRRTEACDLDLVDVVGAAQVGLHREGRQRAVVLGDHAGGRAASGLEHHAAGFGLVLDGDRRRGELALPAYDEACRRGLQRPRTLLRHVREARVQGARIRRAGVRAARVHRGIPGTRVHHGVRRRGVGAGVVAATSERDEQQREREPEPRGPRTEVSHGRMLAEVWTRRNARPLHLPTPHRDY